MDGGGLDAVHRLAAGANHTKRKKGWLALGCDWLLAVAAVVLAACCLHWRMADTTLDIG